MIDFHLYSHFGDKKHLYQLVWISTFITKLIPIKIHTLIHIHTNIIFSKHCANLNCNAKSTITLTKVQN